ncbi:cardiolipin synthase [Candidatus Pantoea edessiphila]|uniref:Cardiolipin synthase A n=1 Tax=Candidatus Pantoea edessiphila TaxID=2044610 RepID=A0A2P5SYT5_9GAMM|nr:cardiolipin synthase [Pantoea sp. Edef]PPI87450.1 cardiolipin synthase [Candidatus Pantoea edessiphila]
MCIYWLLVANITFRILMRRQEVNLSMAWLLAIYVLPVLGIITYLSFGELYLERIRIKRTRSTWIHTNDFLKKLKKHGEIFTTAHSNAAHSLFQLCSERQGIPGIKGNNIQLISDANDAIKSLINDIKIARHNIKMIFYIWHPGGLADEVAESLIKASYRGVKCRLILDSAGSISFFHSHWAKKMRNAGIEVIEALKINILQCFLRRMDLRQHRKLVLIDNYTAYTGSMNLVDPCFFKQHIGVGKWIDLMVRIEGPVSALISIIFNSDWEIETGNRISSFYKTNKKTTLNEKNSCIAHVVASGPVFPKDMMHQLLLTAVYSAREHLIMTTPYFIPSEDLLRAICTAALRGVNVAIVLPLYNDSILVSWASRAFFSELLEAGVNIYQFEGGLLHTKSVLVDKQLTLLGTFNLDMRSIWLNFEITLIVDDYSFSKNVSCLQDKYIANSRLIDKQIWSKRAFWKKFLEMMFYLFSPLL